MNPHYRNEGELFANDCEIEWRIHDIFRFPLGQNIEIESRKFCISGRTWVLKVFPNGRTVEKTQGWFGIALCAVVPGNVPTAESLPVRLSIIGEVGKVISSIAVKSGKWYRADKLIKMQDFVTRKSEVAPGNELTVLCEIQNLEESEAESDAEDAKEGQENKLKIEEKLSQLPKGIAKALKDYKALLLSERQTDIAIKVQDKQFKAHREILAARNPVFAAMLEHNMREKATGEVTIEDMDPKAFPDFLEYLYTGQVQNLSSGNVLQLFTAADKYQVKELREECYVYMKENLSVENFCGIMSVSLRHDEMELIALATQFFIENAMDIVKTLKWQIFMSEHLVAANELFIKQLEFNNQNQKLN